MKLFPRLVAIVALVFCVVSADAQLDFKYQNTLIREYVPIAQPDEELVIQAVGQTIALGFEIQSYGLTCNSLYLFKGYITLFFDNWRYDCHIFATGNKGITLNYSKGKWIIKRLVENGKKSITLEVRDAEYNDFPNEKFNYQFKLNEQGEFGIHYGENNLSEQHKLNVDGNRVLFVEDDYEKNLADTTGHSDSIRSVIVISGDPLEPFVDVNTTEHELGSFTHHPPANTLYTVKTNLATGISETSAARKVGVRIIPNPATGSCLVDILTPNVTGLQLTDVSGRTVLEKPVVAGENKLYLDLTGLPAGSYFLQGTANGKTVLVEKLMVK